MTDAELHAAVVNELHARYGEKVRYKPATPGAQSCVILGTGEDGTLTPESLSFDDVADAAVAAFKSTGSNS